MRMTIRVLIDGAESVERVVEFERDELTSGNLGLNVAEAKSLLGTIQATLVTAQATAWTKQHRRCEECGTQLHHKGHHDIVVRTLFGKMSVRSPRFHHCTCDGTARGSFSPLAELLRERHTPELEYLQTKWASLMSYGMTLGLLRDVLPISEDLSTTAIRRSVERAAQRLDNELGDERHTFIEGTPNDWRALPDPPEPLIVGIDGGYVHACHGTRQNGWFEVIVGKSVSSEADAKCFGFVSRLDPKPKRRLHDMLASQGLQMNQRVVFLSDGGDTVRDLQMRMSPQAEHVLDWFHVTMRLTLMNQLAVGLVNAGEEGKAEEGDASVVAEIVRDLKSVKWNLWHGNIRRALWRIEDLDNAVESLATPSEHRTKMARMLREFACYIEANRAFIPNYGDRWRNGETISTAFVESAVNQIISRRFVKKQQMRWTERGCHRLLQIRTRVLNGEWRATAERWNPGMRIAA